MEKEDAFGLSSIWRTLTNIGTSSGSTMSATVPFLEIRSRNFPHLFSRSAQARLFAAGRRSLPIRQDAPLGATSNARGLSQQSIATYRNIESSAEGLGRLAYAHDQTANWQQQDVRPVLPCSGDKEITRQWP